MWALIIFVITLLPVLLLMSFSSGRPEPARTIVFHKISRVWMEVFFFLTGCSVKVKGEENFEKGAAYIITCNHNSFMDVPLTTPFIPGPNKTIAKVEISKTPLFGTIYKRGSILVNRHDKDSRKNSFTQMKKVLEQQMHMCIYPEGTRNKTAEPLKDFYDGAFKLASETGTSIIPTLLFNTKKVLPPAKGFYFWPSAMEIHFLKPVIVGKGELPAISREKVYEIMKSYYAAEKDG